MDKIAGIEITYGNNSGHGLEVNQTSFLNPVTANPWESHAPYKFPYLKYPRNYVYNLLDYNIWKHFTKDFVINTLFRMSAEDLSKSKKWCDLHAYFCVFPQERVAYRELKYIYECLYEMSASAIHTLLENVKLLTSIEHKQRLLPNALQINPYPLNLGKYQERTDGTYASVANAEQPRKMVKIIQSKTAGILQVNQETVVECYNTGATFPRAAIKQDNTFKQPSSLLSSSRTIQRKNSDLIVKKIKIANQEMTQGGHVKLSQTNVDTHRKIENWLQTTDSYKYLHSSLHINRSRKVRTSNSNAKLAQNCPECSPSTIPYRKTPLPNFGTQFGEAVPQFKSFGPYANASNFEINELGDITFTTEQNLNKSECNNNRHSSILTETKK